MAERKQAAKSRSSKSGSARSGTGKKWSKDRKAELVHLLDEVNASLASLQKTMDRLVRLADGIPGDGPDVTQSKKPGTRQM